MQEQNTHAALGMPSFVIQSSCEPPEFAVEYNGAGQFRVQVGSVYFGWFEDSRANIKAVLVLLREMYALETGERIFTEEILAELVGSANRQAVDQHMKGYRDADGQILAYLQRHRKVDASVVELVWKVFSEDPYASLSRMTRQANAEYTGETPLNEANVRDALSQVSGYRVWPKMLKGLAKGQAHYNEAYLLERLLMLLSEQCDAVEPVCGLPEGLEMSELPGCEAHGESLFDKVKVAKLLTEQLDTWFSESADVAGLHTQLSGAWEGASGLLLLAFVLYSSGLSYAVIGGWMGVDPSTVCRWLTPFSAWGWMWLTQQRFAFSGQVAVDEKHLSIAGEVFYLFAAVDCLTRLPLHLAFYPSNSGEYCRMFLLELKRKGYRPHVVVTDGWDAYIEAILVVFPSAKHMLCRFHLIRSVFRRLRKLKLFDADIGKLVGNLFHSDDPRTVRRRVEALRDTLAALGKEWVVEGLLAKLEQVMPAVGNPGPWPSTSNAAEWFFRNFEHRVYLVKGPVQDEKSAHKLTGLFVVGYLFRMGLHGQACPLERAQVDVSFIPFYHLVNRPKLSKLQELIAAQYTDGLSGQHAEKQA